MHTDSGLLVLDGSASAGCDDDGAVRRWLHATSSGTRARILAPLMPLASLGAGDRGQPLLTRVPAADIDARLALITEPRPEFIDAALVGGRVAPLSAAVHAMRAFGAQLPLASTDFVSLFGAIEWQYLNGPVFADRDYSVSGRVVAIADSPRTEMPWTQTTLHDPALGIDVARMLMLSRLLKSTSPPWAAAPAS